jgi:CRP/FNR family cyclic AMP-dependent transcriptional regulator
LKPRRHESYDNTVSGIKLLKRIPFLSALTPIHLREVYRLAREIELTAGQPVFAKREDPDAMFIVLSGRIKIFTDSAGKKRKTFAYLKEGEFFGEMALVEDLPRTASAQAVAASRLLLIRKADFQRLLTRDPRLALYLLKTVCARLRRANEDLEGMLFRNILGRVAKVMLDQAKRSGEPWNAGLALKDRFTQQERAGLIGTTGDGRYAVPEPRKLAGLCSND